MYFILYQIYYIDLMYDLIYLIHYMYIGSIRYKVKSMKCAYSFLNFKPLLTNSY